MNRRNLLLGSAGLAGAAALGACGMGGSEGERNAGRSSADCATGGGMRLREFGATGLKVSEIGFGSWAIGGQGYGAVDTTQSLRALALAEELGCNFVDTALVYGDSERVLGEFLAGRRERWVIATKYSGQQGGMTATVEQQLKNLRTDVIDFYQVHWMPRGQDAHLLDELEQLKRSGKIRFAGVSLYTTNDIDDVLANPQLDGFQVAFNLLEPDPFLARLSAIRERRKAVIVRSALREGFLTGKFRRDAQFPDPADQRHKWSREQIEQTVDRVEKLRFLEAEAGSMVLAAARYPLSFPEVSTVVLGTKSASQAQSNFGDAPGGCLSAGALEAVNKLQIEMGLGDRWPRLRRRFGWDS